ncbi:MAG: hypothetical protein AAF603_00595 [Pseudomonadota bacterium]
MGRTESLFAGVLLILLAIAVLMVMFKSDARPVTSPTNLSTEIDIGSPFVSFTGNREDDICVCYEQAYAFGNSARGLQSIEYRGGFSACTERLGQEGSNAWTWGWANGEQAPGTPRSCRGYYTAARTLSQ